MASAKIFAGILRKGPPMSAISKAKILSSRAFLNSSCAQNKVAGSVQVIDADRVGDVLKFGKSKRRDVKGGGKEGQIPSSSNSELLLAGRKKPKDESKQALSFNFYDFNFSNRDYDSWMDHA